MLGSFEDLLNGIVSDEPENEEEEELPCNSRFARFFSNSSSREPAPSSSPLSSLGGIKLEVPEAEDDWQQGFRALLPNVNISFSAFSDGGPMPPGSLGGEVPAPAPAGLGLGAVGGLGGLAGFGAFSSQQSKFSTSCNGLHSSAARGAFSGADSVGAVGGSGAGGGLGGNSFVLGASGDQLGGGFSGGLGSAALNGGNGLAGSCAPNDVSLLSQLSSSGPLPGAQLSSQLQSLLQGANSGASSSGSGPMQSSGRAVGGALLPNSDTAPQPSLAAGSAPGAGLWSGSGAGGLMPGWLQSEGLLPLKGDDQGSADGSQGRDPAGGKSAKKEVGGGADRGGKAKKRGGTANRGKGDTKATHGK